MPKVLLLPPVLSGTTGPYLGKCEEELRILGNGKRKRRKTQTFDEKTREEFLLRTQMEIMQAG